MSLSEFAAAKGIVLSETQLEQFRMLTAEMLRVNETMNLTAISDPEEIEIKHYLDSLTLLWDVGLPEGASVVDIGSGAGFPALPLAIARPDLRITVIDSLAKRVHYVTETSKLLGVALTCIHGRAEELGRDKKFREKFDIATARAVARMPVLAEWCMPFVKPGGRMIALKGESAAEETAEASYAFRILGGKEPELCAASLPGDLHHQIVLIPKAKPTPPAYPRKMSSISKKPLTGEKKLE